MVLMYKGALCLTMVPRNNGRLWVLLPGMGTVTMRNIIIILIRILPPQPNIFTGLNRLIPTAVSSIQMKMKSSQTRLRNMFFSRIIPIRLILPLLSGIRFPFRAV